MTLLLLLASLLTAPDVHHLVGYSEEDATAYVAALPVEAGWTTKPHWTGFVYEPKQTGHRIQLTFNGVNPEDAEVYLFWIENGGMGFRGSDGQIYLDGLPPKEKLPAPTSILRSAVNRNNDFKLTIKTDLMWGVYLIIIRDKRSGALAEPIRFRVTPD